MMSSAQLLEILSWVDPEGGGGSTVVRTPFSPGKSQVATGFLRQSGTDPLGSNCSSGKVCMALKYFGKALSRPLPLTEFSGTAHACEESFYTYAPQILT